MDISSDGKRALPSGKVDKGTSNERLTVEKILHMNLQGSPATDPKTITNWIGSKAPKNSMFFNTGGKTIGEIFVEAADQYKVNVYYLVAHAALESTWGTSPIARSKYNFFGIGAYDGSAAQSAFAFGGGGVRGGIFAGAEWISKNYINSNKHKQNTLYKMQNDPAVPFGTNGHNYATDREKGHPLARSVDNSSDPLSWGQKIASTILASPMNPNSVEFDEFNPVQIGVNANNYKPIYEGRKIQGTGGWYDGESFEGISGVYDKPTFLPPHYYDDDFKELQHRYTQGDYFMRVGDTRFVIPPTQIRVSEQSNIAKFQSIRQKQSIKVQSGNKMKTIEMTLMFTDYEQVNGYEMEAPNGKTYYMDGLRSLIAQMKTMPFLPVENEFLNFVHNIHAVAILACNVGVVDGFPGMLKADITMIEFDPESYLNKPAWLYDSHFIWPLFRWHYQRLLNGSTKSGDVLMPFVGDDILDFWYLDQSALENHDDEIRKQNEKKMKEGKRLKTWWDYNDKLARTKGTNALFTQHNIPPNYEIIDINATFGNNLTPLTPALLGKPTFQYFGSQDAKFNILIQTQDRHVIQSFVELKDRVDRYAREYRDGFVSSMLRLNNNFVNMLGVKGVLIESLSTSTIDGSPDSFYISMTLVSFDETQYADESLGHLDSLDFEKAMQKKGANLTQLMAGHDLATFDNNMTQAVAAEKLLDDLELYPDLELPTYEEVNLAIADIDDWRKRQGFGKLGMGKLRGPISAKFVDPDFYFSYPDIHKLTDALKKSLSDPDVKELALEHGIDHDDISKGLKDIDMKEYFGVKALAQIDKEQDADKLKKAYKELGFDNIENIGKKWAKTRKYITDPENYTRRFWMKAWSGEGGHWDTKSVEATNSTNNYNKWKVAYYNKQSALASVKALTQDDFFNGMMHDLVKYDKRGTMMRAFPTYVFVIIDEGKYVNVRKLWDNYYTYHSISEINVHMDRSNPIHTAYIKLSNVYGALNNKGMYHHKLSDPGWKQMMNGLLTSMVTDVKERELIERTIVYKSIQLMAGARIHIRMGYGSCASQLPPVFNGIITEINTGDMVSVVAQSFGYELTNEVGAEPGSNTTMFEQGLEPTELFRYYMTERQSNYTFAWRDSAEPENYQSAYGIEHFGFLRVRDDQTVSDIFSSWMWDHEQEINAEDYDIMKNVYSTIGYTKIGEEEGYHNTDLAGVDLSGLKSKDVVDQRAEVLKIWPKEKIPNILEYKDHKPDFKKLNVEKQFMFIKSTLETIRSKTDAQEIVQEINRKDIDTATRKKLLDALYWWAANPKTYSLLSGNSDKWLSEKGKKDYYKKDIEELFKPIKKAHPELYKEGLGTFSKIVNEWSPVSWALESYGAKDNKGILDTVIDMVTPGSNDDETNVRMQLEGKAPWDIFRTLERVTPEYVVYPHIHQFGYTLFFGKPWWDVQCGYVLPPIKKPSAKYGKKVSDYVELSKPFSQMHFYTSYGDIIGNNIKAVGTDLATSVIPVFQLGKKDEAYEIIWADYYIRGSFQRTKTVDTSLVQNIPYMPNWMESLGTGVLNFFNGATKYQKHSVRFAQGVIAETFKNMYQGELTVIGDPSVKPYDVMYIDDFYSRMNGVADVGGIVQMMSVETGFVTSIKPDLSVVMNPDPTAYSEKWDSDPAVASGNFFRYGRLTGDFALQAWRLYSLFKLSQFMTSTERLKDLNKLAKFTKVSVAIQKISSTTKILATGAGKLPGVMRGVKVVKSVITAFRIDALATAAAGLTVPGPGWAASAVSLASVFASTFLLAALDKMFIQKYNNVIKIFPLFYQGRPYVAGINGHKQLIPGWEDSGSGRPVRVEYGNTPKLSPKKASEIYKENHVHAENLGAAGTGDSYTENSKVNADPAKWLGTLSSAVRKEKMFTPPIMLGKEGKGIAGVKARVTPGSGYRTQNRKDHNGVDFFRGGPMDLNASVLAFAHGEVMYAGAFNPTGYGNLILVKHEFDTADNKKFVFWSTYAHMRIDQMKVVKGDTVEPGQFISGTGNEGGSNGFHLHFEITVAKDHDKASKVKRGMDSINYVFAHGRPNTSYQNPQTFMESIIAYDPKLMKYVEYKG